MLQVRNPCVTRINLQATVDMKNILKAALATTLALLSAAALAAVDVNKANQAELESIKGIGPSMSARIVDARKAGSFKDWADMQTRVKGVRNGNSAKFSGDGLTVNGASYTGSAVSASRGKKAGKVAAADSNVAKTTVATKK